MPSSNPIPDPVLDPRATAEQLVHWLLSATIGCAVGLAIGMLLARLIRSRHLHWSWAVAGLAPVLLGASGSAGTTWTLTLAALAAALWGRRWHREDIEAGADLAELAAARPAPWELLRRLIRLRALRRLDNVPAAAWLRCGELILGRDERCRTVSIPFGSGSSGGRHTLVVGATGSGKTVTQTWMAVRAIGLDMGVVVVDPKGDGGMRDQLAGAANAADRPFVEWTPAGSSVYNPYARGGDSEIADKVLAGERFTEPHYLRQAQRYVGHVVRALRRNGSAVSLQGIVEHLDPARLELLVRSLPEREAGATHAYLDSLSPRQRSDLAGVRDRLAILAESDVGAWLDPNTPGAERFDLLEAVSVRAVVYFKLESDTRPLLAQMLGAAIVQDLQTTVAALQGRPLPTLAVLDEFSAVAAEQVVRLFGRARSAGFSLLLGTQELSDLRPPGRERLLEQVMGNLSVLIAHRQVVPTSAELVSSVAGSTGAWRVSRHSDGRTTRTRTRRPVLEPDQILGLRQGWAAVIVTGGGGARIARIFSPTRDR